MKHKTTPYYMRKPTGILIGSLYLSHVDLAFSANVTNMVQFDL